MKLHDARRNGLSRVLTVAALLIVGLAAGTAHAASYYARTAGAGTITTNWNQNTTWTADADCNGAALGVGVFPGAADDVFICSGKTVNITANAQARSVTFMNNVNSSTNLTHGSGISLTVGVGGVTITAAGGGTNTRAWNINAGSATVNGNVALAQSSNNNNRVARLNITTGTLDVNGDLTMTAGNAVRAVIDMSGGAGNLFISGSFNLASGTGTLTPGTTSTVTYDSATTPVTVATGSSIAYHHLNIAKGVGNVANAATTGNLTVGGNLTVTSGTLNIPGITAAVTGATQVTGTLAFITAATGTKTFTGNVTIDGTWSNNIVNSPVTLRANLVNNGTFTSGSGLYTLNGAAAQNISGSTGATSFGNLALDNANGLSLTGTHNVTITTQLTLTTGPITTSANVLIISNGSDIVSAGGTDFVAGNLRKTVGTGGCTTCNFEVGTVAGGPYTPVTNMAFTGISATGTLTVSSTAAEHPNIATSGIDSSLGVNRYWTLTNAGIAFTSFAATFNWNAADLDGAADTTVFEMQRYSPSAPAAGTWNATTAAAQNPTNIQITGVNGFGDFAVGQPLAAAGGVGRFNAYDTTTAAGAVTGFIMTKVAGTAFNADVVAIRNNRKSIDTGFTGTVRVDLLNTSDNSGALDTTTGCNSSWTVIQTVAPDPVFAGADAGRKAITVTENNSWREVRFRIRDFPAGALIGCSTDAFAIRPDRLAVTATDATWDTAGTTRALDNAGGRVHKAGQPFTITATGQTALLATTSNYDGSPTVGTLACTPATCTDGTLTPGAFSGNGTRTSTTASYSEAGAFSLTLEDRTYAIIDATDGSPADCSAAGRWVCQSSAVPVGRFVPDRFVFTGENVPQLATFGATTCGTRSFTYVGQPFWYVSGVLTPMATLNAVNAAGTVTSNYALNPASSKPAIAESYADASAPAVATLNVGSIGTATLTPISGGTGTYLASSTGVLSYTRSATTPVGPFGAAISLTVTANDATDAAVTGNGTIGTPTPLVFNGGGAGIAFDSGNQIRYGRLRIGNASGSQLVPLRVPLELQHFSGGVFITNTGDTCTSLVGTNFELGSYTPNLNACETSVTMGGFTSGRSAVLLSAAGSGNNGSVTVTARLEPSVAPGPLTCIGGVSTAVTGADKLHLQGNWTTTTFTENPSGKVTFGVFPGADEVIFIREVF